MSLGLALLIHLDTNLTVPANANAQTSAMRVNPTSLRTGRYASIEAGGFRYHNHG